MKNNILLPILLIIFLIPSMVNAESRYLYDVLKNEVDSNGLAREYIGEHRDSFTVQPSKKIYHWYAENDDEGNQVIEKSNVIFAGKCWRILRTTDTGGVKIIFIGFPTDNKCTSTSGIDVVYGSDASFFSEMGYKYNTNIISNMNTSSITSDFVFGSDVTYNDGMYTLINTISRPDADHHYTCGNSSTTCEEVRYYFYVNGTSAYQKYYNLSNGMNITNYINLVINDENINEKNSVIKNRVDSWYNSQRLYDYREYLEDVIFCNNRGIDDFGLLKPNGGLIGSLGSSLLFDSVDSQGDLSCPRLYDQFCVSNDKAQLQYPIALPTAAEMNLLNNNIVRKTYGRYWTMSPYGFGPDGPTMFIVNTNGSMDRSMVAQTADSYLNSVVSLRPKIKYSSGDGSKNNPYVIAEMVKSNVTINNDESKGLINIDYTTNVVENDVVTFNVEPKNGYLVKKVQITDTNLNTIDYTNVGNEYSFEMPASNVTIDISYEGIKSSVKVEILNETENLTVEIENMTQVEYNTEVSFKVTPIKGYKVTNVKIIDNNNNEIEYNTTNNKDFTFIMPASDVTIIPSYERVSNSVIVENNKEIIIEVNDANAVVYEDEVRFTVVPEEGYEIEKIIIKDSNNNDISYRKTDKENEFVFTMPDTDVKITPQFRKLESDNKSNSIVNPKTGGPILVLLMISVLFGTYLYRRKRILE